MYLVTDKEMKHVDRVFAYSGIIRCIGEILVQEDTTDLKLTEFARDGLGHLLAIVSEGLNDAICELDAERQRKERK